MRTEHAEAAVVFGKQTDKKTERENTPSVEQPLHVHRFGSSHYEIIQIRVFRAVRSRLSVCWRCGFSVSQVLGLAMMFRNCFVVDTLGTQKNT